MPRTKKGRQGPLTAALESLGNGLKMARLTAGMSRQRVADQVRVSVQTIYNWEIGRYAPSSGYFDQLCAVYEVRPEELTRGVFRGLAQEGNPAAEDIGGLEPLVARELAKLPREVQRNLVFKWLPLASEMAASIAEARARYEAEAEGSGEDADSATKSGSRGEGGRCRLCH